MAKGIRKDRPNAKSKMIKAKKTPDEVRKEKAKNAHIRMIRGVFSNLGFGRASRVDGRNINYNGHKGEFDDIYVFENLICVVEYTSTSDVTAHIKPKSVLFNAIQSDEREFIKFLKEQFPSVSALLGNNYHADQLRLKVIYCSMNEYDVGVSKIVKYPVYFDYPVVKYFSKISKIIKMSACNEFFEYIGLFAGDVAWRGEFAAESDSSSFAGLILPEVSSNYPEGYKVFSFYVNAEALLTRAYSLRRDGWRGTNQAYQRMLEGKKVEAIRKTLKEKKSVFINNIIATLPPDTKAEGEDGRTINFNQLIKTSPAVIRLPTRANSIGLIDGQHRLFSYYETKEDDVDIKKLRSRQNLLVTGIVYPEGATEAVKSAFEANLFLSINSNQTNASSALRQEIDVVINPFGQISIARQVIQKLSTIPPLSGHVESSFYDKSGLKTSSIVSYGLVPLLKVGGDATKLNAKIQINDSLFNLFRSNNKNLVLQDRDVLNEYIQFSCSQIQIFLNAVKANIEGARWTSDPKVKNRMLTVTIINGFLITMRRLISSGYKFQFDELKRDMNGIGNFDFSKFKSSQYNAMSIDIFNEFFKGESKT
ncbi:MAG: DGQHR domain-containing protein [Niveispirillum sp.]|uniref:DGQHR domain-containing protein n=1 Tax=Niveispirillum sp. TaxID=1917217 RepID=UPI003BA56E1D